MSGSNIFLVYQSADGNNVTLSPRLGTGYTMPNYNGDAQVTLLEGSGVKDGKMVANVRCDNCESWGSGSTADFRGNEGNWVYAFKTGGAKRSDDVRAGISQHSEASPFEWDYANAKGGDSVNPLVNASPSSSGSGTGSATGTTNCVPRPTTGTFASGATGSPTATDNVATATQTGGPGWWRPSGRWPSGRPTAAPTGNPYNSTFFPLLPL